MRFIIILLISSCISVQCLPQSFEDRIVLINVGEDDRGEIARTISEINLLEPEVVALDIAFPDYTGNRQDKLLYLALMDVEKLVLPSKISSLGLDYYDREMLSVSLGCAPEFFVPNAKSGFVSAKEENDPAYFPEQFSISQSVYFGDYLSHHFSIMTAMEYDSSKTINFIDNHERIVNISYGDTWREFKTVSSKDVLKGKLLKSDIESKIIMMGYLGPKNVDKYIARLNTHSNERAMYGLEYLANIVAQILEYNKD